MIEYNHKSLCCKAGLEICQESMQHHFHGSYQQHCRKKVLPTLSTKYFLVKAISPIFSLIPGKSAFCSCPVAFVPNSINFKQL